MILGCSEQPTKWGYRPMHTQLDPRHAQVVYHQYQRWYNGVVACNSFFYFFSGGYGKEGINVPRLWYTG